MTVVGWDSDGVLYNFTHAYHTWMNLQGMNLDPDEQVTGWDWFLEWQTKEQFLAQMEASVDAGHLFWKGELYDPDTALYLNLLRQAGHTNHLVTYRFSGKLRCPKEATESFYARHGITFDSITYSRDKAIIKTDVFLEDNIANYDALEKAGVKSYLINRSYNQVDDDRRRVDSVKEFVSLIISDCW